MAAHCGKVDTLALEEETMRLGHIASIRHAKSFNLLPAHFYIWRRGSRSKVGMPTKIYNPEHFYTVVIHSGFLPDFVYYAVKAVHGSGYFAEIARGSTELVHITREDVKNARLPFY